MENNNNKKTNGITMINKFIIPIVIGFLIAILAVACVNYFRVNARVQRAMENTHHAIDVIVKNNTKTIDIIEQSDSMLKIQFNLEQVQQASLDRQERIFNTYLTQIKDLNKGIIDSNVLTFLFTILLLFSGGFLLFIETRLNKQIDESKTHVEKAEKSLNRVAIEQTTMELYIQCQVLRIFSTNVQNALASRGYQIDSSINILIYEVFKMTDSLIKEFRNDKYKYISKEWKDILDELFEKMIYSFEIDRIREISENDEKIHPIEITIDQLEALRGKISGLIEKD